MYDKRYVENFLAGKPKQVREDFLHYVEKIDNFGEFYNDYNSEIINLLYKPTFGHRIIGFMKNKYSIQIFGVNTKYLFTKNIEKSKYVKILREYNLNKLLKDLN